MEAVLIVIGFLSVFVCAIYAMHCVVVLARNISTSYKILNMFPFWLLFATAYDKRVHKYYYRFWLCLLIATFLAFVLNETIL